MPDFARRHRLVVLPRGSCPRSEQDAATADADRAHVDRLGDTASSAPANGVQLPLPGVGPGAGGWSDVISLVDTKVIQLEDGSCEARSTASWSSPLHLFERLRVHFEHDPGVVSAEHNRQIIAEKEKRGWLFPQRFPDSGAYTLYDEIRTDNYNPRTGEVVRRDKEVFPHGWLGIAHICHECFSWRATSILIEEEICRPHWNSLPQFCYRRHQRTETSEELWNATYVQPLLSTARVQLPTPKVSKIVPLFTLPLGITIYGAFEIQTIIDGRRSLPITLRHYGSYEYKVRRYVSLFRYSTGPSAPATRVSVIRKEEFVRTAELDSEVALPDRVSFREKQYRLWFGTQATLCIFIGPPGMQLASATSLVSLRLLPVCIGLRFSYLGLVMSPPGSDSSPCSAGSHTVRLYSSIVPFVSFGVLNLRIGRFIFQLAQEVGLPYATSMESPLALTHLWATMCPEDLVVDATRTYRSWRSFRAPDARTVSGRYAKRQLGDGADGPVEGSQCPSLSSSCDACLRDAECSWCESARSCMALPTDGSTSPCPDDSFAFLGVCNRAGSEVLVGIATPGSGNEPSVISHDEEVTMSWDPTQFGDDSFVFLSLRAVQFDGGRAIHAGNLPTDPVPNVGTFTFTMHTAGLVTSDSAVLYELLVTRSGNVEVYLTSAPFSLARDGVDENSLTAVPAGYIRFLTMWSACSRLCGPGGVQRREAVCRDSASGDIVPSDACTSAVDAFTLTDVAEHPCQPEPEPCVETPLSFFEEPSGDEMTTFVVSGGKLYEDVVVEYLDATCGAWNFLARGTLQPHAEVTGSFDSSPAVYLPGQAMLAAGRRVAHTALRAVLVSSPANRAASHPFTFTLPLLELEPVATWEVAAVDAAGASVAFGVLSGATVRVFGPGGEEVTALAALDGEDESTATPTSVSFVVPSGERGTLSLATEQEAKEMLFPEAVVVELPPQGDGAGSTAAAAYLVLRANGVRGDSRNIRVSLATPTLQVSADATLGDARVLAYGGACTSVSGAWTCQASYTGVEDDGEVASGVCVLDVASGEPAEGTDVAVAPELLALPFVNADATDNGYEGGFRSNAGDDDASSLSVGVAIALVVIAVCCMCACALVLGFFVLRATMRKRSSATQRHRHRRATSTMPATRRHTDVGRSRSSGRFAPVLLREGSMSLSQHLPQDVSTTLRTSTKSASSEGMSNRGEALSERASRRESTRGLHAGMRKTSTGA